jgi:hypothetical protein
MHVFQPSLTTFILNPNILPQIGYYHIHPISETFMEKQITKGQGQGQTRKSSNYLVRKLARQLKYLQETKICEDCGETRISIHSDKTLCTQCYNWSHRTCTQCFSNQIDEHEHCYPGDVTFTVKDYCLECCYDCSTSSIENG